MNTLLLRDAATGGQTFFMITLIDLSAIRELRDAWGATIYSREQILVEKSKQTPRRRAGSRRPRSVAMPREDARHHHDADRIDKKAKRQGSSPAPSKSKFTAWNKLRSNTGMGKTAATRPIFRQGET
jgi:hypothetical protein